ncbi:MAG TPA: UDP-N-acetylmuramate dehydrogenase [Solimonas sp.]|nr:UDP-N-acetylmuramate dehydrogenase [Solimonas sp.]
MSGTLLHNEPLSRHTSWRVGGPADRYYEPSDRADLIAFVRGLPESEPILWIGLGSNLLVRDGGVRGTVLSLHGALEQLDKTGEAEITAEAGVHCARMAKFATGEKLAGAGFFAGIPGTVGGALAMNAGAHGGETWNCVKAVEVLYRDGRAAWLPKSEFRYGYRHVEWPQGMVGFLAARFEFVPDLTGTAAQDMKGWLARRKATQPVGKPSAGSTFRNPPGDHAARLIESCGLKGHRLGTAQVSTLHANFIITDEDARAADVEALIAQLREAVREKTGVELIPEVKVVGEPGVAECPVDIRPGERPATDGRAGGDSSNCSRATDGDRRGEDK